MPSEDKLKNRTYRNMQMKIVTRSAEVEGNDDKPSYIVEGYATTFNEPYCLYKEDGFVYDEQVDSKAFDECDMSDVIMQYDHQGRVFARTRNETLKLEKDEHGLKIIADLGGTEIGRNLYEEIKGGYTDRMSFGFTVTGENEKYVDGSNEHVLRTITKIGKLYDVSAVSIPANDFTQISARNLTDGVISKIKTERSKKQALELRKRKLALQLKLEMESE